MSLPLSAIVDVQATFTPTGFGGYNDNAVLLVTEETPVSADFVDYAITTQASTVSTDFGSSSVTYKMVNAMLASKPNLIGAGGYVLIVPVKYGVSTFTIGTAGTGYAVNDVVTVVQTGGVGATLTVTEIDESGGITAATLLTAGYDYTVASGLSLSGGTGSGGKVAITAIAKEAPIDTVNRAATYAYFRGIVFEATTLTSSMLVSFGTAIAALGDKYLQYASNVITDVSTYFAAVTNASLNCVRTMWYDGSLDPRIVAAAAIGKLASVNYDGSKTCITMNLKTLSGITSDETVTETLAATLKTNGVDAYTSWANGGLVGYISNGANRYSDEIADMMWLVGALQTAGVNALATTTTKVPQTEEGVDAMGKAYREVMLQAVRNGMLAAGTWTSTDTFGDQDKFLAAIESFGFYIYHIPVSEQSATDRADRKCPLFQIAGKLAGGIHSGTVMVTLNA